MLIDRRLAVAVCVTCVAAAGACSSEPPAVGPEVWAVVNGQEIRADDVEKAYRQAAPAQRPANEYDARHEKLNVLSELILQRILLSRAAALKIELGEADIEAAVKEAKAGVDDATFDQQLASRNLTAADMRDQIRRELTVAKLIEREVTNKIAVTDQEIADYFEANKAQFNRKEDTYHLAEIIVTAEKEPLVTNRLRDDAISAPAATAKTRLIMDRLKKGTPFQELAMDYSEDPQSAPRGGDVGLIPVSALKGLAAPVRTAILNTKVGDVTMIPVQGGFRIVAVVQKQPAGQRDLGMPDVKAGIAATLREPREQMLRGAFVNESRDTATVVNYEARRIVEAAGKVQ